MPLPPSSYTSGPLSPQQLNTDLYGFPGAPSGVRFHGRRPLLSETVIDGGTAYTSLAPQPVTGPGMVAYSIVDTTALACRGADNPGASAQYTFQNFVPASGGTTSLFTGQWLTWNFPFTGPVTIPPGGVGAGIFENNSFSNIGTFQYGGTVHDNCPYHLDLIAPGPGSSNTWKPAFYWLTPSTPTIVANPDDTAGQTSRMGFIWHSSTFSGSGTVSAVPSVAQSWGTVTSAMLAGMGSALTFLNNPPNLRVTAGTGQTFANNTVTIAQFHDAPATDNYAGWSTSVSNYTVQIPGLYLMSPTLVYGTASAAGVRWAGLRAIAGGTTVTYQGASYAATPVGPGVSGIGLTSAAAVRVLSLNAGDQVAACGLQNSGAGLSLYTGYSSRFIAAYMAPQAPAGTVLTYTAPVTGFRFQAGTPAGSALTASLNNRIGNDLSFLVNRPYFTGFQTTSQNGLANGSGFQKVTIDTLGALPRGGNGDNYGGWSAANHQYVAQVAGWYLAIFDGYATPPAATTATLTAGINCFTSGGIGPSASPDWYQQVFYPVATGGPPPGAFAMGMYYLQPGEFVYPMLQAQGWGGTWGTFVNLGVSNTVTSQFSVFWLSS